MYSPGGVQAGKKGSFIQFLYFSFIGDETVPMTWLTVKILATLWLTHTVKIISFLSLSICFLQLKFFYD